MQSRRVPTINGGLPSYDSPRRRSSSPLPKYGASPLCSPAENAESTQGERRWIENFYVWIYDQPVTSPITAGHPLEGSLNNTSPSSQNLSNQLIGGISRHFFNYTGLKPSTSSSENKMPKLPGKKAGRAKKGLMSLAHRPKDSANSQMLESSNLFIPSIGESEKPSLDPQSLSERLDALVDRTVGAEVLRISGTSCYNLQELEVCQSNKSKKSSSSTKTGKLNNKKGLSGSVEASIVRQLALGPGPAMNSSGFGAGKWKLVQGIITEDGHFTLYTNDNVMLHRIYLPSYRRTDIRMVHQSIFGRLHCGVISRRGANGQSPNQSIPPTKTSCYSDSSIGAPMHDTKLSGVGAQLPSKSTLGASLSNNAFNSLTNQNLNVTSPTLVEVSNYSDNNLVTSGAVTPNSIYICMPNSVLIESWLVICKCFCRPDDFRHLYPRSSSRKNVCHHQNSKAQDLSKNHNESNFSHRGSSLKASSSKLTFDASGQVNSREQLYQLPERVRIWRGVEITLLEGKRIGELRCSESSQKPLAIFKMDETPHQEELRRNSLGGGLSYKDIQNNHNFKSNRPWNGSSINSNFDQNNSTSSKIKLEGNQTTAFSSFATPSLNPKQQGNNYTSKIRQTANPRSDKINKRLSGNIDDRKNLGVNNFYFVEMIWDKEVIGRSTIKRNSSPYWKEDFKFTDLGSFKTPLTLNVYQIKKNLKQQINLIGSTKVDFKNLVKGRSLDIWLPIHPDKLTTEEQSEEIRAAIDKNLENKIVGELNISVMLYEQIVLGHGEYSRMLELLNDDKDIDLAYDLANLASNDLERLGELLLRIYDCNDKLLLRLAQMATIEVDGDTTTASILFRGNTLLTKILESYMRMVGSSFLESSIGPIIRRVCIRKTELEIDPSKLRVSGNNRDRVLTENARELNQLSTEIWESMYLHRSKCPSQLRRVFFRIQELVSISYSDPDMRLISISAFIFLRFFVPAILNPRLFNLIQFQPDSKSQRTLTLLAKTLQGLGNMNQFGTKEPWMNVMNEFVKSQSDSFRDYISFISQQPEVNRPEWTSKDYESYKLPLALRTSLPPSSREGVPFLPHLLDLGRDCSLLSSLISSAVDKAATNGWNIFQEQMNRTSGKQFSS
ncbi:expressed protein [Phakopsora pachyrhizi]|uniref:Expressed protein n=1 Tax=Phakopsora pachyrhizi TaxID=170000 RepID=A0AAV0B508_PHAPC|nr:expressed protein [Phakopsora pachyrhizi]